MLFRNRGGTAAITLLASAVALAAAAAGASCASQGQGTNETFTDGSADGTQEASGSSSGGGSGSSSGSASGSSSGGGSTCDADTMGDPFNCGSCGNHCPQGDLCSCGQCMKPCAGGLTPCCGTCSDTTKDPNNCGGCGTICNAGGNGNVAPNAACVAGKCEYSCPDAGAEGGPVISCGADSGAGVGCFDPTNAMMACGGCGTQCGSGQSCVQSTCCASGDGVCGGNCTNLMSDQNNCGACDAGCPSPGQCAMGKCTGYSVTNAPPGVTFIDACSLAGETTVLTNSSQWASSPSFTLPFGFTFYGQSQSNAWVGSLGAMGFGNPPNVFQMGPPDCTGGNPLATYAAIVPFGDMNLATGSSGVCYGVTGTAPNRQFVVTWKNATVQFDTGSVLTFSVILTQTTNTIDFVYETAVGAGGDGGDPSVEGSTASVGMQIPMGMSELYVKYSCNTPFITSTPFAVRFTPL